MTKILEENVQSGTGVGAQIGRPAGGKTGTTDNYTDAWFCGITPTLTATVWIGYPQAEIPMLSVHGITVSGPTFPPTIWRDFMESAIGSTPVRDFPAAHSEPVWRPFTRGQYAGEVSQGPVYSYSHGSTTATTQSRRNAPPPPSRRHAPPPPPPTPIPPPPPPPVSPPPPPEPPPPPPGPP